MSSFENDWYKHLIDLEKRGELSLEGVDVFGDQIRLVFKKYKGPWEIDLKFRLEDEE